MITEEEFTRKTGQAPDFDDMSRVNCIFAGTPGHLICGWCPEHDKPRFTCGCLHHVEHDLDELLYELFQVANEIFLRGSNYTGPCQEYHWRDIPVNREELTNLPAAQHRYWISIGAQLLAH